MNLQVLPLRVLVSRQVIRDRMDYTDYLAGKTRSEMDILDKLAGRFAVELSEQTVQRFWGDEKLSTDEWEAKRRYISSQFNNLFDGTAEISITETSSPRARTWNFTDVDGVQKWFQMTSKSIEKRLLRHCCRWHLDDFIENGKLMTVRKAFKEEDGKLVLTSDYRDSFGINKQGNLVRKFTCSLPTIGIKITKVMLALRVN